VLRTHTRFVTTRRTGVGVHRYNFSLWRGGAPSTHDLAARLKDSRRYEGQIEHLHQKFALSRRLFTLRQDAVSLAAMVQDRRRLARAIAASVADGSYVSLPARVNNIVVAGKERRVFFYRLTDVVVHGALAAILAEAAEPHLSPRVYSYRKGVSWWTAVSDFARFLRAHRQARPDPGVRGLYVLRRDVSAYADSIPMAAASPIWEIIRERLASQAPASLDPDHWSLIERVVRPEFFAQEGRGHVSALTGVATGQPIACVLFNLYLTDLDRAMEQISGGFYARYSDDILFAHPDAAVAHEAAATMTRILRGLGLAFKPSKEFDRFLSRPGRPYQRWPDAKGTSAITFLGMRVSADGTVSITSEKLRALVDDLERRARTACGALGTADLEARGTLVCDVLNQCLFRDWRHEGTDGTAALLRCAVTDREQLAQFDYRLARLVVRVVTGDAGVRAFRLVPYRKVREEWGLRSLLHSRNGWKSASA